jgi:hypothetical protein
VTADVLLTAALAGFALYVVVGMARFLERLLLVERAAEAARVVAPDAEVPHPIARDTHRVPNDLHARGLERHRP